MAYQTYITEAIVCGSVDSNTSNRSYYLFTRNAGMVFAHAQSVREERSKQRFGLQECSHLRVTLVRGKGGWRITGVEPLCNFYTLAETREARALVRNIIRFLRRFIQGETPHESIFDDVVSACSSVSIPFPDTFERVIIFRMLYRLGYVSHAGEMMPYIFQPIVSLIDVILDEESERRIQTHIAYALRESQL